MNGILNLNKPAGMTSHDVVAVVRRILGCKRVGHAGTLDPQATGVLVILVGPATRLAEFASAQEKEYLFEVIFGLATDSLDADGRIVRDEPAGGVTEDAVRAVLPELVGEIEMTPPMFSAVHYQGARLYELARKGVTVEREPRRVYVGVLRLEEFRPDARRPRAVLSAVCSKGTYVRSLAQMIGERVGTCACVGQLVRTRVGDFRVEEALSPEALGDCVAEHGPDGVLLPPDRAVAHLPAVFLSQTAALAVSSGQEARARGERSLENGTLVRAYVDDGTFFAVVSVVVGQEGQLFVAPRKVLYDLRHKEA